MKYSTKTQEAIIELKLKGYSSRKIAKGLLIGKTGVNQVFKRYLLSLDSEVKPKQMRIAFIDCESSPDIAVSFKRFKTSYGQDAVLQDGGALLSIAWRFSDEDITHGAALTPTEAFMNNDKRLVQMLSAVINQSDVICGHNIIQFDNALLNTRLIINKLPPHKTVKMIDTLRIARSMKFQSNRLDSLGVILGVGQKTKHSGIKLWIDCMNGDQTALDDMLKYNKNDVDLLIAVYERLKAFDTKAPNQGLYLDSEVPVCRVCGSTHVEPTGELSYTAVSTYEEMKCLDCGARSRKRQAKNTKEQRSNLLV